MALKFAGGGFFMGLLLLLGLVRSCKAEEPWTPDDFDWGVFQVAPKNEWNGLYINLTEYPLPAHSRLMQTGKLGTLHNDQVLFFPFSLGLLWQPFSVATTIGSVATAIQGCVTTDGSAGSVAGCVFGIAGTVLSIGSAYKAAQYAGWFASAANTWDNSGLELINLHVFDKRSQDFHQQRHEALMQEILGRSFGTPEFLGYVSDGHRLSLRDDDHLHPRAPIYRIAHPKHGLVDIASRQHVNFTRITASYANHGLEIRQSFQHERLSDHLFEGRFDGPAARADQSNPSFDAAGAYQQIENSIQCYAVDRWQPGSVLSAQLYDNEAHATFGFASMGIFENSDAESSFDDYTPSGMPLPPSSC